MTPRTILGGWGSYPRLETRLAVPGGPSDFGCAITGGEPVLARGAGRAYGDAAIGASVTLSTDRLNRMISFDRETGDLTVEAGVRLNDIIETFAPMGFFPSVVPGTALVSVGGMVAANVHGKNHHGAGGMGAQVSQITLIGPDGKAIVCSPTQNEPLFRATIGGMGLTGVIRDVTFRLRRIETSYIRQTTIVASSLDAVLAAFEDHIAATYSVAWIDCTARGAALGRSLLYLGEHAARDDLPEELRGRPLDWRPGGTRRLPIDFPSQAMNPLSIKAFNELYFHKGRFASGAATIPWKPYFFPLDSIIDWNRAYGRRGFLQHQCVLPKPTAREALGEILERVSAHASASFVTVLKVLGDDDAGWLSFPRSGYTLAMDFPASAANLALLNELDAIVVRHGGRLYLAKDARQSRETLEAGYPMLAAFRDLRRDTGAASVFRSAMSERLSL